MKKNNFLLLGINMVFDICDKSRLMKNYTILGAQTIASIATNISKLRNGEDPLATRSSSEEKIFLKAQANNLASFKNRLKSLGQVEFCAWATNELDNDKQFAYGIYNLIENGVIKQNENFSLLKEAICDSLKRNNFKYDYSKPYPNDYKEFINYSHYDDQMIIMKLQRNNFDYVSNRFKVR